MITAVSLATGLVGWGLIGLGIFAIVGAILIASYKAVSDAIKPMTNGLTTAGETIPWKEIFELLKDLLKTPSGLPFIMGGFLVAGGIVILRTNALA